MSVNGMVLCLALAAVAFDYLANRDDLSTESQPQFFSESDSVQQKNKDEQSMIELPPRGVVLGAVYVGQ